MDGLMSNDFYCHFGKHWANKDAKIHTPRQGDYICADCEDKRILHQFRSNERYRRHDDEVTFNEYKNQ
jgi:hypothetical protein